MSGRGKLWLRSLLCLMMSFRLVFVASMASLSPWSVWAGVGVSFSTASLISVKLESKYVMIAFLQ